MIRVHPVSDPASTPGHRRVAAEVRYGFGRTERLWFDVSQNAADGAIDSGNAWLMALLPLAFARRETLEIAAPIDPLLLQNAEKIQQTWAKWFPPGKPVSVKAPVQNVHPNEGKTGLFFSGGMDSFFSLLSIDANQRQVDDLVYVWGFDIPIDNSEAFDRKKRSLEKIAAAFGKNLITVATNLRATRVRSLPWGLRLCGPAMGATGQLLGHRLGKVIISSSGFSDDSKPWGTHPLTDPLMSSSTMEIIHYGAGTDRFGKTRLVATNDTALKHLQVCWRGRSDENCGKCEKCCRTLLTLEMFGVRAKAASFPPGSCSPEHLQALQFATRESLQLFADLRGRAIELGREDIARTIETALTNKSVHIKLKSKSFRSRWKKFRKKFL